MLEYLYLAVVIFALAGQNVVRKPYTQKANGGGSFFFTAVMSASALAFFALTSGTFDFDPSFLPYSAGFAASYSVSCVFVILAITYGSLSLTSLFISYSLMLPTLYGLLFLKDPVGGGLIPGLVLLAVSLFLINRREKDARFSVKWLICVLLAFFGNGMCSVVQKMEQVAFGGAYKREFMMTALAFVTVFMLIISLWRERGGIRAYAKTGWYRAVICGLLNGTVNLLVMIIMNKLPASLMFPLISAGGLTVTYLVARFWYKESLTKTQLAGFICGLGSVVLLNIK